MGVQQIMGNITLFRTVWGVLVLTLVVIQAFFLGIDLQAGDWQGSVVNGILLAFWVFAVVWFHSMAISEIKSDYEHKIKMDKLKRDGQELIEHLEALREAEHDERLEDAMYEANEKAGVKGRPPRPSEFAKVEKAFHEITKDHYLRLSPGKHGRPDAEISDRPFKASKAAKKSDPKAK